jgi:acetyl esterase/lipase
MKLEAYLHSLIERSTIGRLSRHATGTEERRRAELAAEFRRLLGDYPAQHAGALEPRLLERAQCEGYTRERVEIATLDGLRMAMYVLVPDRAATQPAPAVIACHGHGYGSREIVGLEPDGAERAYNPGLHKDFAVALVREGFVVVAPELIGFGDRRLEEDKEEAPGKSSCFRLAASLLLTGKTLAGMRVYETSRAIDYLQGRSEADPGRIAIMGISGGEYAAP